MSYADLLADRIDDFLVSKYFEMYSSRWNVLFGQKRYYELYKDYVSELTELTSDYMNRSIDDSSRLAALEKAYRTFQNRIPWPISV